MIRVRENGASLAMTLDCNSRYVAADPYVGAQAALAEAVRNVSVVGARPLAISDCLNFGNPEKGEVMWQFSRSVDGLADACRFFKTPVISGNVSFYNDTRGESVPPTPVVALVGLIEPGAPCVGAGMPDDGEIILLGSPASNLDCSEYLFLRTGLTGAGPPPVDLEAEAAASGLCRALIADRLVLAAHDVSDGGLAVALAEMCLIGNRGAEVELGSIGRIDVALFGEGGPRILVVTDAANVGAVQDRAGKAGVPCERVGHTGGQRLKVAAGSNLAAPATLIDAELGALRSGWDTRLDEIAVADH